MPLSLVKEEFAYQISGGVVVDKIEGYSIAFDGGVGEWA